MARCRGASSIIMTDISQSRLDVAQRMGADQIMLVGQGGDSDEALAAKIVSLNGGHQFDASIECSGASASIRLGIFVTPLKFFFLNHKTQIYFFYLGVMYII